MAKERVTLTGYLMAGYVLSALLTRARLEALVLGLPDRRPVTRGDWAELALEFMRDLRGLQTDLDNLEQVIASNGAIIQHVDVVAELERLLERARGEDCNGCNGC